MMSNQMHPQPRVGVGIVVLQNGRILLGKRKGSHGAGTWSVPGGHLEFKETVEECTQRELFEETGLKTTSIELGPWTNNVIDEYKHYITLFVFINEFEGEPKLLEPHKCEGWAWFDMNELPSPLFPPVNSLIAKMKNQLPYSFCK